VVSKGRSGRLKATCRKRAPESGFRLLAVRLLCFLLHTDVSPREEAPSEETYFTSSELRILVGVEGFQPSSPSTWADQAL
jgi:hypothetical protein